MKINIIGLGIAKNIFHLYTVGEDGGIFKKMLRRKQVLGFFPIAQVA